MKETILRVSLNNYREMKKLIIVISIYFLGMIQANCQNIYKKIVIDSETHKPISDVHVFSLDHYKTGTITNENGIFILNLEKNDSIFISHISYYPLKQLVDNLKSDTIKLKRRTAELNEITVLSTSGKEILNKVISSLSFNHSIEPIVYNVYLRIIESEKDYSELHILSEYVMNIYQNKNHNSEFQILKVRAKPFSKAGKKYFKDMRMMHAIDVNGDNIFKYKEDILKRNKLKNFNIKITDEFKHGQNRFIELKCIPKKGTTYKNINLLIDSSSFGIKKITKYYTEDEYKEIEFKEVDGKWYLQHSKRKIYSSFFNRWKQDSKSVLIREVIYNIDNSNYESSLYKKAFNLIAEPIKPHLGDWSDKYWENYNYIPLPEWISLRLNEQNSR